MRSANDKASSPEGKPDKKSFGDWGEDFACELLVSKGCAIRERKYKIAHAEVDIIAQKGKRVIFVEVKTRRGLLVDPVLAVNHEKRRRIVRAADAYMQALALPLEYQFDIISIRGTEEDPVVEHIEDAFFPSPRRR